ncbi:hypothetical protein A0H81_12409 [Grifola frondosa]|uniref:Uncharacterized protein n=1 Tax=Grifola frondosa TaxID=5627 RepID=A0A1C7LSD8_GRIFR|nr:hypothetical protein A0H81_12409 [Grifola frondosa]
MSSGFLSYPVEFPCSIKPRSAAAYSCELAGQALLTQNCLCFTYLLVPAPRTLSRLRYTSHSTSIMPQPVQSV